MIRANIAELKNRLSHYLRLVRGGEVIEILDRKTPLARIEAVGSRTDGAHQAAWVQEMCDLGIITPPRHRAPVGLTEPQQVVPADGKSAGVLDALLKERESGR